MPGCGNNRQGREETREWLISCLTASVQHIGSGEYRHQEATTRAKQVTASSGANRTMVCQIGMSVLLADRCDNRLRHEA